jgi:hypothetical protein
MTKQWLAVALVLTLVLLAIAGTGLLTQADANQRVAVDAGWRFNDGYWNYWDADDRAWYHTDGRNWYTYGDGDAWTVYKFDKKFGNKYYREGYRVPEAGADITLPRHRIKVKVD